VKKFFAEKVNESDGIVVDDENIHFVIRSVICVVVATCIMYVYIFSPYEKPTGEAFIKFSTREDAVAALQRHKQVVK
jgi:hypothetical protein